MCEVIQASEVHCEENWNRGLIIEVRYRKSRPRKSVITETLLLKLKFYYIILIKTKIYSTRNVKVTETKYIKQNTIIPGYNQNTYGVIQLAAPLVTWMYSM